jgi:hypothetical protein
MFPPTWGGDELMGSLSADLVGTPQRERAGETAQERFEFQALWGMALLFRQHDTDGDYAVIFEFHDDLALVDDPLVPAMVRFFQVKTKENGSWKLTDLKRRKALRPRRKDDDLLSPLMENDEVANVPVTDHGMEKAKALGPSILGKMFHNVRQFGDPVASVTFVSNASCDLHLDRTFDFRQCAPGTLTKLIEAVQAEYADATEAEVALLGFERTDLSLHDGSTHMKGKLHEFVRRHAETEEFPLDSLYRLIMEECRKRSKFTGVMASFGDVVRLKGITREDVQGWLDTVKASVRIPSWEELNSQLMTYPFDELLSLRAAWSAYRAEVLNQADEALRSIRRAIRVRIGRGFGVDDTLPQIIEAAFADVEKVGRSYLAPFQPARLKAMIIYELYTKDTA